MAENEQVATQTIEIPQPLSPEHFRACLIMDVKENLNLESEEELSDDDAYRIGIENIFERFSEA